MDIRRRDLLKFGLLQGALMSIPLRTRADSDFQTQRRRGPSILQGATDETRTQFSIVHEVQGGIEVFARDPAGFLIRPDRSEDHSRPGHAKSVNQIFFSGLKPDQTYRLVVLDKQSGQSQDERSFQTLNLDNPRLRFALCSCMDDSRHEPEIWKDLVAQKPDVIFFVGDSVYCDDGSQGSDPWVSEDHRYRRFCEARCTLEIYYSSILIPILATWDDHDFAQDNVGNWYPYVAQAQQNFRNFFAQDSSHCRNLSPGIGVGSSFISGGQQFLLLDDRSFRSQRQSGERFGHWGEEQENWMIDSIQRHAGPTWLLNGSQFFPQLIFKESVSGDHPEQFNAVLEKIRKTGRRVLFASGDVHYTEISKIESAVLGFETYEITSSSIHSYKLPGLPGVSRNPRRVQSTGEHNYVLIDSQTVDAGCHARVESRSARRQVNFTMSLQI